MRTPNQYAQRTPLRFNITPLIDVVFLLIIFFLVASHFVRNEQSEPVTLPVSGLGAADHDMAPQRLTVTVTRDGTLSVGGQVLSEQGMAAQLSRLMEQSKQAQMAPEVRIRSDREAAYLHVRRLIEECAARDIRSIRFAVASEP